MNGYGTDNTRRVSMQLIYGKHIIGYNMKIRKGSNVYLLILQYTVPGELSHETMISSHGKQNVLFTNEKIAIAMVTYNKFLNLYLNVLLSDQNIAWTL